MERIARCACGQLRAVTWGEPLRRSICHCRACQQRTGSAFGLNATWPAEQVRIEGQANSFTRSSDEGYWSRSYFCPECGGTLYWEIERRPGMISIAVGCFADEAFPEPTVEVYGHRRRDWIDFDTEQPLMRE